MNDWMGRLKEAYFSFRGRLNRRRFWIRLMYLYFFMQILGMVGNYVLPSLGIPQRMVLIYSLVITLFLWMSSASLWVRRFHDCGTLSSSYTQTA